MIYKDAEIYLTECIHPDFNHLKYLGLDTKKDPNYLGSSVTLKWWINYLGRRYFTKTVLETITGTMRECCELEQKYILEHNAVKSPNYFNMNGEKLRSSVEDMPISLDYLVKTNSEISADYIRECLGEIRGKVRPYTFARRMLAKNILCILLYGSLKYNQEEFEYNRHSHYGTCRPEDLEEILSALAAEEYLDFDSNSIYIQDKLRENTPVILSPDHFKVVSIYNN